METVAYVVALLLFGAFGWFVFKKVTAKRKPGTGAGGGGKSGSDNIHQNLK